LRAISPRAQLSRSRERLAISLLAAILLHAAWLASLSWLAAARHIRESATAQPLIVVFAPPAASTPPESAAPAAPISPPIPTPEPGTAGEASVPPVQEDPPPQVVTPVPIAPATLSPDDLAIVEPPAPPTDQEVPPVPPPPEVPPAPESLPRRTRIVRTAPRTAARQAAAPAVPTHAALAPLSAPVASSAGPLIAPHALSGLAGDRPPLYPASARARGAQGRVVLRVVVSAEGVPVAITVARTSGHDDLDTAATEAVHAWRFAPATRDGAPVSATAEVPVSFRLEE